MYFLNKIFRELKKAKFERNFSILLKKKKIRSEST